MRNCPQCQTEMVEDLDTGVEMELLGEAEGVHCAKIGLAGGGT